MQGVLSPDRSVEIILDHAETVPLEPFFARTRDRSSLKPAEVSDVEQLASGVWQLKPKETNLFYLHETTAGQAAVVRQSSCHTISVMTEIPMQRKHTELTGLTYAGGVSTSGDHFMIKRIPAGTTWDQSIVTSTPSPTLSPTPNLLMQRAVEYKTDGATGADPEDQGYLIRWQHPGNPQSFIDYLFTFIFGSPVSQSGYGMFALTIGGAGRAKLHEWISGAWSLVDEWVYAPPELITRQVHALRIVPHAARFIEFRCVLQEPAQRLARLLLGPVAGALGINGQELRPTAHVYEATNRGGLAAPGGGLAYPMTGPGGFRMDLRQDVRFPFQVARLSYPTTGYLVDTPFKIPNTPSTTHALEVVPSGMVRYATGSTTAQQSFTPQPINATSGANLSTQTENYTENGTARSISGWQVPGSPYAVKVKITLSNPTVTHTSPWLFGYEVRRRGDFAALSPTPIVINNLHGRQSPATRMLLDQGDEDPSHARASLQISDLVNRIPQLVNRGEFPIRITSTYDPADQTKKTVLWEGYVCKSESMLRGNEAAIYPSPDWHDERVECLGKWKRMAERDYPKQALSFVEDTRTEAPVENGRRPPWKVTDAIRHLCLVAGFPEAMTDIPDLPLRFWTNNSTRQDHLMIQIGDSIGEWIQQAAHTYLNYFLCFDQNASTAGMWRLKRAPRYGDTAIWNYAFGGPPAGRLAMAPGSYGANTTPVDRDTYHRWVVAPEFNWLQVTGILEGRGMHTVQVRNPKSYNRPGESTADSTDPDYLGRLRPVYGRPDPRLCTPEAVKFAARTIFERAGRAAIYARFSSPAVFVAPGDSVYTTYLKRPHMFGDVVTLNGDPFFVRNCRIEVVKAHHQIQHLELQQLRQPLAYS